MFIMHVALGGCLKSPPVSYGLTEDTGGHIAYILEAVAAAAQLPEVTRLEIVTRAFTAPELGLVHAQVRERLNDKAAIVRLRTVRPGYLAKDALARELPSFTTALLEHTRRNRPDIIHAHFADAAEAALAVRAEHDVPVLYTAHSLGKDKPDDRPPACDRVRREERALREADAIICSSRDEAERQIPLYTATAEARTHRIVPGISFRRGDVKGARRLVSPFLREHRRPVILAVARPVPKKNLAALVDMFGRSSALRQSANLVIAAGLRDGIEASEGGARSVYRALFDAVDRHDLWGRVALPRRHDAAMVEGLYALAAESGGIFVNPALAEPYGLTLTEAAAHGLPVVATDRGGPPDIVRMLDHGVCADPTDPEAFTAAMIDALTDRPAAARRSALGRYHARRYSWDAYARQHLRICRALLRASGVATPTARTAPAPRSLLMSDIDGTLTGDAGGAAAFSAWRTAHPDWTFAISTGRCLSDARAALAEWDLPEPDVFVTSVGTEIHYAGPGGTLLPDALYAQRLAAGWRPDAIADVLRGLPGLEPQRGIEQRRFKRSYLSDTPGMAREVERLLRDVGLRARVVFSHGRMIDIVPLAAGKGMALDHVRRVLKIPQIRSRVAGDSGNDLCLLTSGVAGVVPANHTDELSVLKGRPNLTFSTLRYGSAVARYLEDECRSAVPELTA